MSAMIGMEDVVATANETVLAKNVAEVLHKHYPGHLWAVNVDTLGGIVKVFNMRLSGRWGFILHLDDVQTDPSLKCVMRAGGEILERYRLKVGRFSQSQYENLQEDHTGNFVAEK